MHVAVVNLTSGGFSGGYRKYLDKMVPLLRNDKSISRLDVFFHPRAAQTIDIEPGLHRTWVAKDSRFGYRWLRSQIHKLSPDVVFVPTARWFECGRIPTAVMVRNMEPLVFPFNGNYPLEGIRNLARAFAARRACRRARRGIAVSQYVRNFLIGKWHISASKIGVVYHGVETAPGSDEVVKPNVFGNKDLSRFVFTAGSIRPARGLEDLFRGMPILLTQDPEIQLIIAGKSDRGTHHYKKRMDNLADELGIASRVFWAGHLSALEMSWCFYNCAVFVMTSRAEACPNIALEAMNHGALCISCDNPPMPEIFGDAALFYPSRNSEALASVIISTLSNPTTHRDGFRQAALRRAAEFSWEQTAIQTAQELKKAIE